MNVADDVERLKRLLDTPNLFICRTSLEYIQQIGSGGFATVEASWYKPDNGLNEPRRKVAVKRFRPEVLHDDTCLRLLCNEIDIMINHQHRHIVGVIGIGAEDPSSADSIRNTLFLVQEYLSGGNLKKVVLEQMINYNAHGLKTATLMGWCIDLAAVLFFLHSNSPAIAHRDIKLENIMLTKAPSSATSSRRAARPHTGSKVHPDSTANNLISGPAAEDQAAGGTDYDDEDSRSSSDYTEVMEVMEAAGSNNDHHGGVEIRLIDFGLACPMLEEDLIIPDNVAQFLPQQAPLVPLSSSASEPPAARSSRSTLKQVLSGKLLQSLATFKSSVGGDVEIMSLPSGRSSKTDKSTRNNEGLLTQSTSKNGHKRVSNYGTGFKGFLSLKVLRQTSRTSDHDHQNHHSEKDRHEYYGRTSRIQSVSVMSPLIFDEASGLITFTPTSPRHQLVKALSTKVAAREGPLSQLETKTLTKISRRMTILSPAAAARSSLPVRQNMLFPMDTTTTVKGEYATTPRSSNTHVLVSKATAFEECRTPRSSDQVLASSSPHPSIQHTSFAGNAKMDDDRMLAPLPSISASGTKGAQHYAHHHHPTYRSLNKLLNGLETVSESDDQSLRPKAGGCVATVAMAVQQQGADCRLSPSSASIKNTDGNNAEKAAETVVTSSPSACSATVISASLPPSQIQGGSEGLSEKTEQQNYAGGPSHVGCAYINNTPAAAVVRPTSGVSEEERQYDLTGQTGSHMYMAPEVFLGLHYNHKADVFSFGVALYELMHRRLVQDAIIAKHPNASPEQLEHAVYLHAQAVSQGYRPEISNRLPGSLRSLIQSCWSGHPADRPDMEKVVRKLRHILKTEDLSVLDVAPGGAGCSDFCVIA
ncbi:hypothetical protein CEUSTIGMA_g4457.t1 [Chlamydomonas eustigma]|uniref:Protein kinase domain-containing protein n=1 Tax=Chlamydomonas eustigma TaxID=1157962 RepID=A0A250X2N0_9CHLO|nr:hypothetical protein CEUSTIGMA_g4457.t1 [Chlamydomonas eustigma]|eukprot:GAX77010.1 hypothetical protein CEUSTIGMA_g4457.t1 [Chlamydomonas eustigma]